MRVKGDSMEPIYCDGDIVMISRERPGVGDIALVTMDGCGYIKRLGMVHWYPKTRSINLFR